MTPDNNLKSFPTIYAAESDYVHKTYSDYITAAAENYSKGFEPLQTLPASWYNSLLYLLTEQAKATKELCDSIFAELKSILTAGDVEPNAAYTNQLLKAIETITHLNIASASVLGGIKSSADNWKIQVDATTAVASVNTVDASTSVKGIVQLSDEINDTSQTKAATANAVKKAVEAATPGIATTAATGVVKASSSNWGVQVDASTGEATVKTVEASTSAKGIVQLNDTTNSTSTAQAATANAVKKAFDNGVFRATCSTAAATAAKTVTAPTDFALNTNTLIAVTFVNANTAANPTLAVGSTGAKAIRYYNTKTPSGGNYRTWEAYETVLFSYDGTYWKMLKDNAMYLSGSTLYIEC